MFRFMKTNSVQKKDPVLYNFNKQPVINTETGEFLMDFDNEQRKILRRLLDRDVPIGSFAYKGLPATHMVVIEEWLNRIGFDNYGSLHIPEHKWHENIICDIVHTDFAPEQMIWALEASEYGVNMCRDIEDVAGFTPYVLAQVTLGARYGVNLCDKVYHGMNPFEFEKLAGKIEEEHLAKDARKSKLNDLTWKMLT